jgi:hypothetical protein
MFPQICKIEGFERTGIPVFHHPDGSTRIYQKYRSIVINHRLKYQSSFKINKFINRKTNFRIFVKIQPTKICMMDSVKKSIIVQK